MTSPADRSPWRNSTYIPTNRGVGFGSGGSSRGRPQSTYTPKPTPTSTITVESLPPDRHLTEGLDKEPLQMIGIPSLATEDEDVKINNYQYLASYNWTDNETPTIIIPGSPPQWQNRTPPYNVRPDVGVFFVDQNGYRMPKATLLPLVTAVNLRGAASEQPNLDWSTIDFVTDRNGLRKLMRWVSSQAARDFRIDLELAGKKTVLMNRWERHTQEVFNGRTYGFSFEKASTLPANGCGDSTGHHRIVTYDLNGLKMVVRFEVDACIPPVKTYPRRSVASVDELTASLASVDISNSTTKIEAAASQRLNVIKGGSEVSTSAIIELTTRSEHKLNEFNWQEAFPQLFFSQTTHHFLAVHNRGRFTTINKRKLSSPELQQISQELQPHFRALRRALDVIKALVIEHGQSGRLTLLCKDGVLSVYKRTSQDSCLPDNVMSMFD